MNRFHAFPWIVFMFFHEFEKSQAAEQEQFSNFMDRGFALAVKKLVKAGHLILTFLAWDLSH